MSRRLYVGNIHFEMSDTALRQTFSQVGGVENVEIIKDRWTGTSRGFGFVEMITAEDATAAIGELDGVAVMGRAIRVALAKPKGAERSSGSQI
jgi:RNA recognition motif-containing protein